MAFSPEKNAGNTEIIRYDLGWDAINAMLRAGRSLSGKERNCCFLNSGGERFADVSGAAGLDFADDGRVLALSDWDYDGDIDFWVANRSGPQIRYLQNELPSDPAYVNFKLEGVKSNRDAIGSRVVITYSSSGKSVTQTQTLKAGEGYLAQNSKWLHFGLAKASQVDKVEIFWPSGATQVFANLQANSWYQIREGTEEAESWEPPQIAKRDASEFTAPPISDKARIVLLNPIPLSTINYKTLDDETRSLAQPDGRAKLVNLWATWCQPCMEELAEWKEISAALSGKGVDIVAINVDEESADRASKVNVVTGFLDAPFEIGLGDENLVAQFDTMQRALLSRQRPLPLPSSFLIDGEGRLRIVYKGKVDAATLMADAALIRATPKTILDAAIPFKGRWAVPPKGSTTLHLTVKYIDNDLADTAREYVESLLAQRKEHPEYLSVGMINLYGAMLLDAKEYDKAREAFNYSLQLNPNDRQAHIELGTLLMKGNRGRDAEPHFVAALRTNSNDPELLFFLGMSRLQQGKLALAKEVFEQSVRLRPTSNAFWQLGTVAVGLRNAGLAIQAYEKSIELAPGREKDANNLAWLLATSDDDALRNGQRALMLAKLIVAERVGNPSALDTLAAAHAETGDFASAIRTATQALDLAKKVGDANQVKEVQERLKSYQSKKPYRASL